MKGFVMAVAVAMLVGCSSPATYVPYPSGVPIRVTSGYDTFRHVEGDEFVFSIKLPPDYEWYYAKEYPTITSGRIRAQGGPSTRRLQMEWSWESRSSAQIAETIKEAPIYLPWYSGQTGDGSRIPYTPTEKQIKSGDWYSVGYPRNLFHHSAYRGVKKYYCLRSVRTRGGRTAWDREQGVPAGASYEVTDLCPFRTTDGREANFVIRNGFWISAEELQANPDALDARLEALDAFLQPSWDSLEVTPIAYQFEPPNR